MAGQASRLPWEHVIQWQAGRLPYKQKRGLPKRTPLYLSVSPRRMLPITAPVPVSVTRSVPVRR